MMATFVVINISLKVLAVTIFLKDMFFKLKFFRKRLRRMFINLHTVIFQIKHKYINIKLRNLLQVLDIYMKEFYVAKLFEPFLEKKIHIGTQKSIVSVYRRV